MLPVPESLTFCGRTFGADRLELMRQMSRKYSRPGSHRNRAYRVRIVALDTAQRRLKNRECRRLLGGSKATGSYLPEFASTEAGEVRGGRMDPGHQNPYRWQAPRANASPWNWLG